MAGGTWKVQNKVRPGAYVNFKGRIESVGTLSERGVVAFPAPLAWGNPASVIILNADEFAAKSLELIGYGATDKSIAHIAAAMNHANQVLLYRLGGTGAEKATVTEGLLTATAKWGGIRGNDLKVVIAVNVDDQQLFDVVTLLDDKEVDKQTVTLIEELQHNAFIHWSGQGELSLTAGVTLTGGKAGNATSEDFSKALTAFEAYSFNVLGVPLEDNSSKQLTVAYIKRQRETEGKNVQAVLVHYPEANYEGIISLRNGVITKEGEEVAPTSLIWEIAAMQSGANVNESLTYTAIPGAVDAYPRLSNSETIEALKNGELVITALNKTAVIEQDINTLTSYSNERSKAFSKNRVIRTLDAIGNDTKQLFEQYFLGKMDNSEDGRSLLKGEIVSYLTTLQGLNAIQNFDSETDIEVVKGTDSDAVLIQLNIQPVDSIEKIYMTVEVL